MPYRLPSFESRGPEMAAAVNCRIGISTGCLFRHQFMAEETRGVPHVTPPAPVNSSQYRFEAAAAEEPEPGPLEMVTGEDGMATEHPKRGIECYRGEGGEDAWRPKPGYEWLYAEDGTGQVRLRQDDGR